MGGASPSGGVPGRAPHGWGEGIQLSWGAIGRKGARLHPHAPATRGSSPSHHPIIFSADGCSSAAAQHPEQVGLGFPTGFPPRCTTSLALVPAAPSHGVPLHRRRRLCSRIKLPRQSQDAFAIADTKSGRSELNLPPSCILQQQKGQGIWLVPA